MPDYSFEELIPIFSARYSGDQLWLRPAMKRYGIWRLVHRSHPGNSRPMTRSPRNNRITIIYQILHLMYCRTYVNLYDAVRSVIPWDKLHKHQFLCFAQVDSDCAIFSNFVNKGDTGPHPPYFFFYWFWFSESHMVTCTSVRRTAPQSRINVKPTYGSPTIWKQKWRNGTWCRFWKMTVLHYHRCFEQVNSGEVRRKRIVKTCFPLHCL